jgi:pimeloyl-ACP methyl ester carboxylesterase
VKTGHLPSHGVSRERGASFVHSGTSGATIRPSPTIHSPADEARGWARLAAEITENVLARTVHHVHRATSARIFRSIGPVATPVRAMHDVIAEGVHTTIRVSVRGLGAVGAVVAAEMARKHDRPWHDRSRTGSRLAAIAHGLVGDLPELAPPLDLPLTLREDGRTVPLDPAAIEAAFPDASSQVVVFLHGLVEDETIWDAAADRPDRVCLPATFAEHGFTPVRIRYGTGAPIGTNGAALDALLDELLAVWPRPVERLVLVGHSMGGLVARSACAHASERGHAWTGPLEHIAYLGSPHFGSPLEQVVHRASERFSSVPEVRPFIDILERRSPGVRDLRHGTLTSQVEELLDAIEPAADDPWLEGVEHHLVVGRLHRNERHPVNRILGDLLVTASSATGRGHERRIDGDRVHILSVAANHFGMCWHPEVADHLVRHLTGEADAA